MFIAPDPHSCMGEVVANGHCMRHVQTVASVSHSSTLRRGVHVLSAPRDEIPRGAVIGTFNSEGRYDNSTDGTSHVAVLLDRNDRDKSLRVVDQWVGKAVSERTIHNRNGSGRPVNDASCYYVVESV